MRNLASSIQVEYEKVSSDRRVCDFETVFPLTGRSVGSRPLRSTSAAGGSGAHGRYMADGAVAPVDARMRVQDVWSGATTREPRRESQLTYPVGNSCGICVGQMLCFVVVEWSHAPWCLLLSCSLSVAAFGPLSTRYGFPSGNSLTAPIDASATVTPVSCEVLLTCCVVHDYMY